MDFIGAVVNARGPLMPEEKRELTMFIEAYQGIVRDGVDPKAMHNAMLAIDEYLNWVEMDMLRAI